MTVTQVFFTVFCASLGGMIWQGFGIRNSIIWAFIIQWVLTVLWLGVSALAYKVGLVTEAVGAVVSG